MDGGKRGGSDDKLHQCALSEVLIPLFGGSKRAAVEKWFGDLATVSELFGALLGVAIGAAG